jgi:hypothetical protein
LVLVSGCGKQCGLVALYVGICACVRKEPVQRGKGRLYLCVLERDSPGRQDREDREVNIEGQTQRGRRLREIVLFGQTTLCRTVALGIVAS